MAPRQSTGFLDLPPEIRNTIYQYVFTPYSRAERHIANHDPSLSLTWLEGKNGVCQNVLGRPANLHVKRPSYYNFLFTNKQIHAEAIGPLAEQTTLRLAGTKFCDLHRIVNEGNTPWLSCLLHHVSRYTHHLMLDQQVLTSDPTLIDALAGATLFPELRKLTLNQAGPRNVTTSGSHYVLTPARVHHLAEKKEWPHRVYRESFGRVLELAKNDATADDKDLLKDNFQREANFVHILQDLRNRLDQRNQTQTRKSKLNSINVIWKFPLSGTVTSAHGSGAHLCFNVCEITQDFDTNKITYVSFAKQEMGKRAALYPKQYRRYWTMIQA